MRYSCMYSNIIDCVEERRVCMSAWKDKNFKANGIFNIRIRAYLLDARKMFQYDNDRNTQKIYHSTRESCMCNNGVVKFIGNWTIWRYSSRYAFLLRENELNKNMLAMQQMVMIKQPRHDMGKQTTVDQMRTVPYQSKWPESALLWIID